MSAYLNRASVSEVPSLLYRKEDSAKRCDTLARTEVRSRCLWKKQRDIEELDATARGAWRSAKNVTMENVTYVDNIDEPGA